MWFGRLQDPIPGLAGISEDTDPSRLLAFTRFGFAPLPVASGGSSTKTTPLSAQCVAMSAGTQSPQAAWKWAKFLTGQRLLHDSSQVAEKVIIPARPSVAEASGFWASLPAGLEPAVRYGLAQGWYPGLYATSEAGAYSALEQAAVGGKDLLQALTEAKTRLAAERSRAAPDANPVVIAAPEDANGESNGTPTIRFYPGAANSQEIQTLQNLAARFNQEHTDPFTVSLIPSYSFPENQGYFESLANDFDCFVAQVDPIGADFSGTVLDLNAFLDGEPPAFRQDYDPALLDRSRSEGALYDLPLVIQPAVVAYNEDLLVSNGRPLPANDWTYGEFVSQITEIAALGGADQVYGVLSESQAVDVPGMLLAGQDVQWLDVSGNFPVAHLSTPEMANSLTWLSELYRTGAVFQPAAGENWWASIASAIQSGQVAYWTVLAGQQNSLYFEGGQKPSFRIGIAPLPAVSASVAFDASIERGLYLARRSPHAPACWTWAKYLSEQPVSWYGVPARTSVSSSPAWEASIGSENAGVYRQALARLQRTRMEGQWKLMALPFSTWRSQAEMGTRDGQDLHQLLTVAQQKADMYQACLAQADLSTSKEAELSGIVSNCAKQADPSW
jgi:ABC-type glycerol-3-phosphate transport system substrate-binding protein